MRKNDKKQTEPTFLKIIYFDELAAQDYLDITNGGRLDWSKEDNRKRAAEILTEIEAQAQGGFNILNFIKGSLAGNVDAKASGEVSKLFDSTIKNTLLTDYIKEAYKDERVKKFVKSGVYAPENSISLYKMYSSYLTVVPKDQMPIDMEKLNDALLGERGYYGMLLKTEDTPSSVLRFNINAFKNNYNLADLSKMELVYYGIKVGACKETELTIDKEFDFQKKKTEVTAESILDGDAQSHNEELYVSITNMYIQNPPIHLQEQIKRAFGDLNIIEEIPQKYNMVTEKTIRSINIEFDKRVIGQQAVKEQILKAIFPIMNNVQCKPIVLLFYGNSGIGKTETAQFLTEQIGGKILRKQFSMYQNNEFANYLFGGKYNEKSFAKDLIARDSNVILLDEFDKAYSVFHSAFYQLFDEGIYEDQNYRVDVRHAIIICTSNYKSKDEIKEKLGDPIFNRFDGVIKFEDLSQEAKKMIAAKELKELDEEKIIPENVRKILVEQSTKLENAREIRKLIKDTKSLIEIREICK